MTPAEGDPRIRPVEPADVDRVVALIYELAEYERLADQCHITNQQLEDALFGPQPSLFGLVATSGPGDGPRDGTGDAAGNGTGNGTAGTGHHDVVGYALYFLNFSTWEGAHGIYLEDLYVRPDQRGSGLGRAMLATLARIAVERGYARVEWWVLDWNTPSIDFYRALGAVAMDGWTVFRLTGPALRRTAAETG